MRNNIVGGASLRFAEGSADRSDSDAAIGLFRNGYSTADMQKENRLAKASVIRAPNDVE